MISVEQEKAELDALTREVAYEKKMIKHLTKRLEEETAVPNNKAGIAWFETEIAEHQKVLVVAERLLLEAAGAPSASRRRGRPPAQERG